jgi:hypothetical protein
MVPPPQHPTHYYSKEKAYKAGMGANKEKKKFAQA